MCNYFRVDMYIRLVQFKQTNIGIRFRIQHYVKYISGDRCIAAKGSFVYYVSTFLGIWYLKDQKLFKTFIRSRFQGKYWRGLKTNTLTSIQHTAQRCVLTVSFPVDLIICHNGSNKSTEKETGKMHLCALCPSTLQVIT